MVFWSSFSKKIKQAVSQISFDALKRRVDTIETSYATKTYTDTQNNAQDVKIDANTTNITTNANNITALDTKVDGVITGLKDGNLINYTGVYNATTTYRLAQATAYNDLWYVSNVDNNIGHIPTGQSDAFWERISAPVVNLQPYLTKTEASNTYLTKTDAYNTYALKTNVGATIYDYEIKIPDGTSFRTGQQYSYSNNSLSTGLKILNAFAARNGYGDLNYNGTWTWFYNDRNGQFGFTFTSKYDWTANNLVFCVYAAKENVKVINKTAS